MYINIQNYTSKQTDAYAKCTNIKKQFPGNLLPEQIKFKESILPQTHSKGPWTKLLSQISEQLPAVINNKGV